MSTCISTKGEFSQHITNERFACTRCFAFDEDAALERIEQLESRLRADMEIMHIAGIDGPGAERSLAAYTAKVQADALREAAAEFEAESYVDIEQTILVDGHFLTTVQWLRTRADLREVLRDRAELEQELRLLRAHLRALKLDPSLDDLLDEYDETRIEP